DQSAEVISVRVIAPAGIPASPSSASPARARLRAPGCNRAGYGIAPRLNVRDRDLVAYPRNRLDSSGRIRDQDLSGAGLDLPIPGAVVTYGAASLDLDGDGRRGGKRNR